MDDLFWEFGEGIKVSQYTGLNPSFNGWPILSSYKRNSYKRLGHVLILLLMDDLFWDCSPQSKDFLGIVLILLLMDDLFWDSDEAAHVLNFLKS